MVEPYLNLNGRAEEALCLYKHVFDTEEPSVARISDMPENPNEPVPPEWKDKIAHAEMTICGTKFNVSDMQVDITSAANISLMIHFATPEELRHVFEGLSKGGKVLMEPSPQPYAKLYTWILDPFGVGWQLICD